MNGLGISAYGGFAGRIVRRSLSLGTLINGFLLALVVLGGGRMLGGLGTFGSGSFLLQLALPVLLARLALAALRGEESGSVFSPAAGSWRDTGMAALRYVTLTASWLLPMLLADIDPTAAGTALGGMLTDAGGGGVIGMVILYCCFAALTPPVFLIVAVGAERFVDLVSPAHWERMLGGRGEDLLGLYASYLGGVLLATLALVPGVLLAFLMNPGFGTVALLGASVFLFGLAPGLLARLVGTFVRTDGVILSLPAPAKEEAIADSGDEDEDEHGFEPAGDEASLPPAATGGKPPLLHARERITEIEALFDREPEAALGALETLRDDYAAHPLVMHALCLLYLRADRHDASVAVAEDALPQLLLRGNIRLAADLVAAHIPRIGRLGLRREELLHVARTLTESERLTEAEAVLAHLLEQQPKELSAVKAMIRIAEARLEGGDGVEAARVYRYLLERDANSPLAEFLRRGLDEAERRRLAS